MKYTYSIIIPAYNEADAIGSVLTAIAASELKEAECIVIDDASSDATAAEAAKHGGIVRTNVQNFGYGYSLKRGIREATHEHIIILDADGSYPVSALPRLIEEYEKGFDMVVGARQGSVYRGSLTKRLARVCFRMLSEFATGRKIPDINSGCRIFRKDIATRFFHTLSSGFSFTTTITLAFMLNAYSVRYVPIEYHKRTGKSKVRYLRDTLRSTQIIVEAIVFYNPLKMFLLMGILVWFVALLALLIAHYAPSLALLFFGAGTVSILVLSLGFISVFLKFMHEGR